MFHHISPLPPEAPWSCPLSVYVAVALRMLDVRGGNIGTGHSEHIHVSNEKNTQASQVPSKWS